MYVMGNCDSQIGDPRKLGKALITWALSVVHMRGSICARIAARMTPWDIGLTFWDIRMPPAGLRNTGGVRVCF
jgi:hypothetical protein